MSRFELKFGRRYEIQTHLFPRPPNEQLRSSFSCRVGFVGVRLERRSLDITLYGPAGVIPAFPWTVRPVFCRRADYPGALGTTVVPRRFRRRRKDDLRQFILRQGNRRSYLTGEVVIFRGRGSKGLCAHSSIKRSSTASACS